MFMCGVPTLVGTSEHIFLCGVPILFRIFERIFICSVPTLFWTSEHIFMCDVPIMIWTSEQNFMYSIPTLLPHSLPSWNISLAWKLTSLSLQNRASIGTVITERASKPASQPAPQSSVFEFCAVSPTQYEHFSDLLIFCLMPELHGRCQTVCPSNRKWNSSLICPLNILNWTNGSQLEHF